MIDMDAEAFEALVVDELDLLPDDMIDGLDNVVFVVEDRPEDGSLDLLGLYDGVVANKDAIDAKLKDLDESSPAYRALQIRQFIGSASVKKVYSMANQVGSDDRLHDLLSYHAARTGRPTGNGPQPTNLPKAGPKVYRCGCGKHSSDPAQCKWCLVPRVPGAREVELAGAKGCDARWKWSAREGMQVRETQEARLLRRSRAWGRCYLLTGSARASAVVAQPAPAMLS